MMCDKSGADGDRRVDAADQRLKKSNSRYEANYWMSPRAIVDRGVSYRTNEADSVDGGVSDAHVLKLPRIGRVVTTARTPTNDRANEHTEHVVLSNMQQTREA